MDAALNILSRKKARPVLNGLRTNLEAGSLEHLRMLFTLLPDQQYHDEEIVTFVTDRRQKASPVCARIIGDSRKKFGKVFSGMVCCAYCGAAGVPLGRDHVPPKSLYPPSRKTQNNLQLITVPACSSCNGGYSDDEAHFRTVMLMAGEPNEAVHELMQKTWRSFGKVDGRRRLREIYKLMIPVKVAGEDRRMIYPGRDERVLRVVRKIVRGLAHHHGLDTAIAEDRVWTDVLKYPVPAGLLESVTLLRSEHDIFQYWFEECVDAEIASIWYLKFFEKRIFVASIAPV